MSASLNLDAVNASAATGLSEASAEFQGGEVSVKFVLPDGTTSDAAFKSGNDVALLKVHLEKNHGLSYGDITLFLGEKLLIDPLSLTDVGMASGSHTVTVKTA